MIASDFTILIDQRERPTHRYTFAGIVADASDRRGPGQPIEVRTEVCHLVTGDYQVAELAGTPDAVACERKSLVDLFSTLGQSRARFQRELHRLAALRWACVVVEADWPTILGEPPPRSQMVPKTIFRSVIAWQQRFRNVHWWFCQSRAMAEVVTYRLLERAWKDSQTAAARPRGGTRKVVMA